MSEIPKAYEPQSVEDKWYDFWLKQGCFTAEPARVSPKRPAYSIVIPPPNVTGMLTMGHVLNNTIQDILARKARMDGKEVLWLPGTDHAGIATQTVVEKDIEESGRNQTSRRSGPREISRTRLAMEGKTRRHHHPAIEKARLLLRLDARTVHDGPGIFALRAEGVRRALQEGPHLSRQTHGELGSCRPHRAFRRGSRDDRGKGHLWHLKYPLLDDQGQPKADEFVVVATTRPETMLGDEAVAVNPKRPALHETGRAQGACSRCKTSPSPSSPTNWWTRSSAPAA